jgi:thioredoxin-related protein
VHLRGVYESEISLLPLSGSNAFKSIAKVQGIKSSKTALLSVSNDDLPGEFVLRFNYKEKIESTSYPSEMNILINNQDLELWVNPMHINNTDSTRFPPGEKENTAFVLFSFENSKKKEKLGLLQQFLMNYDDTQSQFYQLGIEEYEKRRLAYNLWIDTCVSNDKALFVSSLYRFQYVPQIPWDGSEKDRIINAIDHYFDGIDFNDPIITKTSQLNEWMNNYVNIHGQLATSMATRDSLISSAAFKAVEKAKSGHPIVYGWMVDYFYRGFETNNIPAGMKVLKPYLDDPNCLTFKRMEIDRRLQSMESLVPGSKAPNIEMPDSENQLFILNAFNPTTPYILILFWSADCSHCIETIDEIYPWYNQLYVQRKLTVIAVSLDESKTEVKAWNQKITTLSGWTHLRAEQGVNSKIANDYFVLATPVMILLDANTKEIISSPKNLNELMSSFR